MQDKAASIPDLELVGHTDDAEFALGMCSAEPLVASGGKDKNVSPLSFALPGQSHAHKFVSSSQRAISCNTTCFCTCVQFSSFV